MLLTCLVLGMFACCSDALGLSVERVPRALNVASGPVVLARASCSLSFTDGNGHIHCRPADPHPSGADTAAALSPFGPYVFFNPTNLVRDSVRQAWSFNGAVQNLMGEPLGTLNGTTIRGVYGVVEGLQVTSGTGTVTVANADGKKRFTAPNQPYFRYAEILAPNQASAVKAWRFRVTSSATSVLVNLAIVADFPAELSVSATPPDSEPRWFRDDSSWAGPTHQGELKGVVSLCFKDSATVQKRQLAVAFAGGTIVGGEPVDGGDGCYYMKAPNIGSDPMDTAINRLESLPQVDVAGHTDQAAPGSPHVRIRPKVGARGSQRTAARDASMDGSRQTTAFFALNSGSGRHNLAIWLQLAGVWRANGAALDQESPGSSPGGATATRPNEKARRIPAGLFCLWVQSRYRISIGEDRSDT